MIEKTLTDMCYITTGKLDSNAFDENGTYPFFTCAPQPLRINTYAFDDDVILLAGNNANGNFHCTRFNGKFNAYQRTYVITPKNGYNIDYIYYSLLLQLELLKKQSSGSQTKFLTMKILNTIKIQDISLLDQIRISKSLALIDSHIKKNNDMVQKLQVLAHTIFNKYFSNENSLISLLDFPYINVIKPGINKFNDKKHYIATAEVEYEQLNYNAPLIDYDNRENRANMQPLKNSVWFAKMKNSIKHIFVTANDDFLINNYIFSTGFTGVKCEEFAFEYLVNYLNLSYFENTKNLLSHGATQESINNEDLKNFKIHLPSKDKLISFHNETNKIYLEISKINNLTNKLTKLKEKLIPLLINGQLE